MKHEMTRIEVASMDLHNALIKLNAEQLRWNTVESMTGGERMIYLEDLRQAVDSAIKAQMEFETAEQEKRQSGATDPS